MRLRTATLLITSALAATVTLSGCSGEDPVTATPAGPAGPDAPVTSEDTMTPQPPSPAGTPSAAPPPVPAALTITVTASDGATPVTWTLTCDPPGGTHPSPETACAALATAVNPFAPVPKDMACTEIYGGPETARISGSYDGERVSASYSRTNGCEISRWEKLAQVFREG